MLHAAGELPPPDVSPRGVIIAVVNRVLRTAAGGLRTPSAPFGMLAGARCVAWTPAVHPFVCILETRHAVRVVVLMLCRWLGSTTGSEVARRVLQHVFTGGSSPPGTGGGGPRSAFLEPEPLEPPPLPTATMLAPPPRVGPRFDFFIENPSSTSA